METDADGEVAWSKGDNDDPELLYQLGMYQSGQDRDDPGMQLGM